MNIQDQNLVRQMIQQEMTKSSQSQRFNLSNANRHQHNRTDGAPISANDITPGNSIISGSITFQTQTTYTIGVNFNPTSILLQGTVVDPSGNEYMCIGSAQFGPSFYLQPGTNTSVVVGGAPETKVQTSTFGGWNGSKFVSGTSKGGHIVDVFPGGTIQVRADIIGYSNKGIQIEFTYLTSGWYALLNFTIT